MSADIIGEAMRQAIEKANLQSEIARLLGKIKELEQENAQLKQHLSGEVSE